MPDVLFKCFFFTAVVVSGGGAENEELLSGWLNFKMVFVVVIANVFVVIVVNINTLNF